MRFQFQELIATMLGLAMGTSQKYTIPKSICVILRYLYHARPANDKITEFVILLCHPFASAALDAKELPVRCYRSAWWLQSNPDMPISSPLTLSNVGDAVLFHWSKLDRINWASKLPSSSSICTPSPLPPLPALPSQPSSVPQPDS